MAINVAMNGNIASIQIGYTQTSTVNNRYDSTQDVQNSELPLQDGEAGELQQEQGAQKQGNVGKANVGQTSGTAGAQKSEQAEQSTGTAGAGVAGQASEGPDSDVAARTLRLSMADNSNELQAKFNEAKATNGEQQPNNMTAATRRQVMLRNMQNMVKLQLAQYTGTEPYSKANYREILGAVNNMQSGGLTKAEDKKDKADVSDNEVSTESAEHTDGVYKLYSGKAAQTLAMINGSNNNGGGDDNFDLVA